MEIVDANLERCEQHDYVSASINYTLTVPPSYRGNCICTKCGKFNFLSLMTEEEIVGKIKLDGIAYEKAIKKFRTSNVD